MKPYSRGDWNRGIYFADHMRLVAILVESGTWVRAEELLRRWRDEKLVKMPIEYQRKKLRRHINGLMKADFNIERDILPHEPGRPVFYRLLRKNLPSWMRF